MDLSADAMHSFENDGFVLLPGFYDFESEIAPIQEGIRQIVELSARRHGLTVDCDTPLAAMTRGYMTLISTDRSIGSEIYDAVKQIPAFMRLVMDRRNEAVFKKLRAGSIPGIAAGGYGIRIDNPREHTFRAPWHQEFPAQLRSLDGIVFWSPLLAVQPEMGPVEIAGGSHKEGIVPVFNESGDGARQGAYGLRLDEEERRLAPYVRCAPLTKPGDLLLMDFLTLHQSGENLSDRPRWSMQFRYFNFAEPTGIRIAWRGSFSAGVKFSDIMPELKKAD
ncbi:MAG: phytanoyl-CoA dioxygenase family protein [Parvibaculum sp.]|nr:phytanoyl-CoA dioxygenase family protein [Parvibaculum sp.]